MHNQRYINALKQAGQKLIDSAESICGDVDQSKVDKSMEIWLNSLEDEIKWTIWLFGHYHDDRKVNFGVEMLFYEIQNIAGVSIDHSFLNFKKELTNYGYQVGKISMKEKSVSFEKK